MGLGVGLCMYDVVVKS